MAKKTASPKKSVTKSKAKPVVEQPLLKIPPVWKITKTAAMTLWEHKKLFLTITLIYGLLNLVLVQGLSNGTDVGSLKTQLNDVFTGNIGALVSSLSVFSVLVSSSGNSSSQTAGAYQLFLALITSLAIIWALRQVLLGNKFRARDAFYRGVYPLVPFILVLLFIGLQLVPLVVGSTLYSTVMTSGIAANIVEKVFWTIVCGALGLLSLYMISSSLFALYIVTLPNMTPMKALRSAKKLVRHRRWTAMRKILCLPVILLIASGLIMVPIIILITPLAQWVFFVLTMFSLIAIHTYMYTLYRELISE